MVLARTRAMSFHWSFSSWPLIWKRPLLSGRQGACGLPQNPYFQEPPRRNANLRVEGPIFRYDRCLLKSAGLRPQRVPRIRVHCANSLRRFLRRGQRNRGFAGEDAEGEYILEIQPNERTGMAEVADRNVLPDVQLKITASGG
jgi:hypothetical protein